MKFGKQGTEVTGKWLVVVVVGASEFIKQSKGEEDSVL